VTPKQGALRRQPGAVWPALTVVAILLGVAIYGLTRNASPANLVSGLIDMTNFVEQLPRRMNSILDRVANNELSIHVDAIDERRLMEGLQKIANRITTGLVLAALILGAAMLMNVPTSFRILGYPGLAMIFFVMAAAGGVWLTLSIVLTDVRARRR
jgi:hypothetical protein